MNEIVWLVDDKFRDFPVELVTMGAYYSLVKYTRGGIEYDGVLVSNDDIIFGDSSDDEN